MLEDNGFEILGPYANISSAMKCLETIKPDVSILDIDMGDGTTSEPVAKRLMDMGLPFAFVTGYGDVDIISKRFEDKIIMHKPVRKAEFIEMVRKLAS